QSHRRIVMNITKLVDQIRSKQSFLCVGLDTDIQKMPAHLSNDTTGIFDFNKAIIDATHDLAVAYKINTAFYEALGVAGYQALEQTVAYLKKHYPDQFVIADAKRGDIGNTSTQYAKAFFEAMDFDAVTVAPYMGRDSVEPFLQFEGKYAILLALTSNHGAFDFQTLSDVEGQKLYEHVIRTSQSWTHADRLMYVLGATKTDHLAAIRKELPKAFFLVPGVGAQGGNLEAVYQAAANDDVGLLVNASRSIIFADSGKEFALSAREAAQVLQQQMKALLC
ncbi:MAG: orotidine-5'-phosphate decarboxylase, partial [Flavobacteriaceae bacterium]